MTISTRFIQRNTRTKRQLPRSITSSIIKRSYSSSSSYAHQSNESNANVNNTRDVAILGVHGFVVRQPSLSTSTSSSSSPRSSMMTTTMEMIQQAFQGALLDAQLSTEKNGNHHQSQTINNNNNNNNNDNHDDGRNLIDAIIALPSLAEPQFMPAHYYASQLGLFTTSATTTTTTTTHTQQPRQRQYPVICKTIDCGGAGPITALLEGMRMIQASPSSSSTTTTTNNIHCVAILAGDAVGSMNSKDFLTRAEGTYGKEYYHHDNDDDHLHHQQQQHSSTLPSPIIPHGYDMITQHYLNASASNGPPVDNIHKVPATATTTATTPPSTTTSSLTRDQLRMVVCLQSLHAGLHPQSLFYQQQQQQQKNQTQNYPASNSSDYCENQQHYHHSSYTTLNQVREAPDITSNISLLECAYRADGAACIILASTDFVKEQQQQKQQRQQRQQQRRKQRQQLSSSSSKIEEEEMSPSIITVLGNGGESSGPLFPTPISSSSTPTTTPVSASTFAGADMAMLQAYQSATRKTRRATTDDSIYYKYGNDGNQSHSHRPTTNQKILTASDIDFFGLYDCFPICLVRGLEAAGICPYGQGGTYIEHQYERMIQAMTSSTNTNNNNNKELSTLLADPTFYPINTHGGLLCFGAPWEVPAMYNIIEAVHHLRGTPMGRKISFSSKDDKHHHHHHHQHDNDKNNDKTNISAKRALVYGNGGIFSHSAVAILERS